MEDSYVFWIVLLTKHTSLVNHSIVYFFYRLHVYTYKGLSCLPSCMLKWQSQENTAKWGWKTTVIISWGKIKLDREFYNKYLYINGRISNRMSYKIIWISLGWVLFIGKVIKTLTLYACGNTKKIEVF